MIMFPPWTSKLALVVAGTLTIGTSPRGLHSTRMVRQTDQLSFKLLIRASAYKNIVELNKGSDCPFRYVIYELIKAVSIKIFERKY